jgi:hypothetical protein
MLVLKKLGNIRAMQRNHPANCGAFFMGRQWVRPVMGGYSAGHHAATACTIGTSHGDVGLFEGSAIPTVVHSNGGVGSLQNIRITER